MTTFAQTLAPSVDSFLRDTWGRTFAHLPGAPGRFHELLSWDELNRVLQTQRLEPPRLRLARNGEFAAKNTYLRYEGNRGGARVPHIVPEKLTEKLREGYTLIVDAVDDMVDGVLRLAEDFERVLHESVQVNMYAGWREQQGFNRHCDTHDVVVLQVYGRKYWRVYEGGRPHPLKDDISPNKDVPQRVVWEGTLDDGDVLYIPRGWWHEASGVGDVTLHLTFGIHQRTGVSMMRWLTDQLRASDQFRADLLRFASPEERAAQMAELRQQLLAAWDDDLVARYLQHHDAHARSRGWAGLPWTVSDSARPAGDTRVELATPRALQFTALGDSIRFEAHGRSWSFASPAEPLLRRLSNGPATLDELSNVEGVTLDRDAIEQFVVELARQGLAKLVSMNERP
jgi:hypothetical protein